MTTPRAEPPKTFAPEDAQALDEPVRRYLCHALAPGAPLAPRTRLRMVGRIKVGVWLGFRAGWEGDGRSFRWAAMAGPFGVPLLRVVDSFAAGRGQMDVRLRGGVRLVHAESADTARSAAERAAGEAIWTPAALLPDRGVGWHAESDEVIVVTWDVAPERPQVRLRLAPEGAVRTATLMRWDDGAHGRRGYVPFGVDVLAERRFGAVTIPSRIRAGWWHGTRRYAPFVEATITAAEPVLRA